MNLMSLLMYFFPHIRTTLVLKGLFNDTVKWMLHLERQESANSYRYIKIHFFISSRVFTRIILILHQSILEAVEGGDVENFTNKVAEYDHLSKLDNWKTTILLRIKKSIQEEPSLT